MHQHVVPRPSRAAVEGETFDDVGVGAQSLLDHQLVAADADVDDQVVGVRRAVGEREIAGGDACAEAHGVGAAGAGLVDYVLAVVEVDDIGVISRPARKGVVIGPAREGVISRIARQGIVAGAAGQGVVVEGAGEGVVAGGGELREEVGAEIIPGPGRAAVEGDALDDRAGRCHRLVDGDAVGAAHTDVDDNVVWVGGGEGEGEVAGGDAGAEADCISSARAGLVDCVDAVAGIERIGVVATAARQRVISGAAGQGVIARATRQRVTTSPARQGVVGPEAGDDIVAGGGLGCEHRGGDVGPAPDRGIDEGDAFDAEGRAGELFVDGDVAVGAKIQYQVGVAERPTAEGHAGGGDGGGGEGEGVVAVGGVARVIDHVGAVAGGEAIGIGARATREVIVARIALQGVIAGEATEGVIPGPARQGVGDFEAVDHVVAGGGRGERGAHVGLGPHRGVVEVDLFEAQARSAELVVDQDAVAAEADFDKQVVVLEIAAAQGDVAGGDAGAEGEDVGFARGAGVVDFIDPVAEVEQIAVGAAPALEVVVALAAFDGVGGGESGDRVGEGGAGEQRRLDRGFGGGGAVVETNFLDAVIGVGELPDHGHHVAGAGNPHHQIIEIGASAGEQQIARRDAGAEQNRVGAGLARIVVGDHDGTVAKVDLIGVVAGAAGEIGVGIGERHVTGTEIGEGETRARVGDCRCKSGVICHRIDCERVGDDVEGEHHRVPIDTEQVGVGGERCFHRGDDGGGIEGAGEGVPAQIVTNAGEHRRQRPLRQKARGESVEQVLVDTFEFRSGIETRVWTDSSLQKVLAENSLDECEVLAVNVPATTGWIDPFHAGPSEQDVFYLATIIRGGCRIQSRQQIDLIQKNRIKAHLHHQILDLAVTTKFRQEQSFEF